MALSLERVQNHYRVSGACVDIEFTVLGVYATNCYLISDGSANILVDPGDFPARIQKLVGDRALDAIFVTHNHLDHIGALAKVKELFGAPVYASEIDAPVIEGTEPAFGEAIEPCPVDVKVSDGQKIVVGNMEWKVISTPGHTPGSVCFFLSSENGLRMGDANVLVSGDTLFCGSIGRTDFPGGSNSAMNKSLKRLRQLPDDTLVLPGHNSLTTIAQERNAVFRYFI